MDLIFDRTQADITNDTDKAYISYADLNRIEQACAELAELIGVTITTKTWLITDFRTTAEMTRLHDNIKLLQDSYYRNPYSPTLPTTFTFTSITQANNIEECLYWLWAMFEGEKNSEELCGYYTFGLGGDF